MEVVKRQADLFEIVLALHSGGRLADLLDRRQQKPDQDGNDCDHDEEFDQRERRSSSGTKSGHEPASGGNEVADNAVQRRSPLYFLVMNLSLANSSSVTVA